MSWVDAARYDVFDLFAGDANALARSVHDRAEEVVESKM
jgi:hypothetical protein